MITCNITEKYFEIKPLLIILNVLISSSVSLLHIF